MKGMSFFSVLMLILFFISVPAINAQQKQQGKNENQSMGMRSNMENCIEAIASDSTSRMEMMNRMMDQVRGDSTGMMQICKKVMENPEMHKMMMKMMNGGGMGGMMKDEMKDRMNNEQKGDKMDHDMNNMNHDMDNMNQDMNKTDKDIKDKTPQTPVTP